MNWLYWNYIINSWNYLKEHWNYLKENWNDLDYKSKRCVYFMLFIFFSVFSAPTLFTQVLPKLYNLSKKQIINIVSLVEPILMGHYYRVEHLSIPNHIYR